MDRPGSAPPRLGSREAQRWRLDVMIDACDGPTRLPAQVLDISTTGLRLRTLAALRPGQAFWVRLPAIEAHLITVKWSEGPVSGCSFAEPLAACALRHLIAAVHRDEAGQALLDRRRAPRL